MEIRIVNYLNTINILLVFFLLVSGFFLITSKLSLAGLRSFVVITGSMEPKILVGSSVIIKASNPYKVGDVIAFNRGNLVITHRIVKIQRIKNQIEFVTKGDANKSADTNLVYENSVIGKVILQIPYIGKLMQFLRTVPGFSIFIVVPCIFIIASEFKNIRQEIEKEILKKIQPNKSV